MFLLVLFAVLGPAVASGPTESPPVAINWTFTYMGDTITFQGRDVGIGKTFFGVPFGVPPVGDMRFKPAQVVKLSGYYNTTEEKPWCAQHKGGTLEDCLYFNMWLPQNISADSKLPVYVYFFGGAYHSGGPSVPGTGTGVLTNIVNRGPCIFILPNYRIGPFGFLSTRDDAIPGNAGLTDWIAVLDWVQTYIRFFGGDPTKVTIGGASAGAISVSFLTMTRKADGLFRGAIHESGSSFLPSFMSYDDDLKNASMIVAVETGCATYDQWKKHDLTENQKIAACLMSKSSDEILAADSKAPSWDQIKWGLVPDKDYLPGKLETLALQRRPIPIITGTMNLEWLFWMVDTIKDLNITVIDRESVTKHLQDSYAMTQFENPDQVYQQTKALYIDSQPTPDDDHFGWCRNHMDLWTEMGFTGPSFRDAKYFAFTGSPVYVYIWYEFPMLIDLVLIDPRLRGAFHSLQLIYIYMTDPITDEVMQPNTDWYPLAEVMGKMWTNFIVTGNPTPKTGGQPLGFTWEPLDSRNNYLEITADPHMAAGYNERALFWVCNVTVDGVPPPFCPL